MGMLLVSSSVKTLENCALRTSALSLSSVALVPSGLSKSGIEALVVRVELTYLQNSLLLFLISLDIILSNASLSFLVSEVTLLRVLTQYSYMLLYQYQI